MRGLLVLLLAGLPLAAPAAEATSVRRLALLVGVNDGGPGRARLRYAATDAEAFGKVMGELGGVAEADRLWVLESDREGLLRGFERLERLAEGARQPGVRVEVIFYYSGHSDEEGLLLRGQRLSYHELRAALDRIPAAVRIAVVDSCASGALSRTKGGQLRPAFLVDASAQVRGHAILTSSAENEVSQESDRIRGSFFTHHLVSGLRGAADFSRDGRVTLIEAYQFAFQETLARTEGTRGGAQHPGYDIELAGTGDFVMTDLRAGTAGLALGEPLDGRLFVRDASGALMAEVDKRPGTSIDLALPPGRYSVRREAPDGSALAEVELRQGRRTPLMRGDFVASPLEATAVRGDAPPLPKVPLNLSLFPAFSTNDAVPEPVENTLALGIATRSAGIDGAALALVGTLVDQDARGFQGALIGNVAGGNLRGGQLSLGGNLAGATVVGAQFGAFYNGAGSDVTGAQLSPGGNVSHGAVRGAQLGGVVNWAETASWGLQQAAGVNLARGGWRGAQLAGLANWAGALEGVQLGLVNVGGDVAGAQLGLVNVAGRARGLQLGLINVSGDPDVAPIGLVSVVRQGQLHGELFASDLEPVNLALKLGSRRVYSTLLAGTGRDRTFLYGYGVGVHLGPETWWVDLDATGSTLHAYEQPLLFTNVLGQLRAVAGFQLSPKVAIFAGPTANGLLTFKPGGPARGSYLPAIGTLRGGTVQLWPGLELGLRI